MGRITETHARRSYFYYDNDERWRNTNIPLT